MADIQLPSLESENSKQQLMQHIGNLKQALSRSKSSAMAKGSYAGALSRHPFDVKLGPKYRPGALKLLLRVKEMQGLPKGGLREHLPLPAAVKPVVTS